MKNKIIAWRTFMHLPQRPSDYGKLAIEVMVLNKPSPDDSNKPVPVYTTGYGARERLEIKFQSNHGVVESGTENGPHWYGGSMSLEFSELSSVSLIMPWLAKKSQGDRLYGPQEVIALLTQHARHVAYSCSLSEMVDAARWADAENYRCYHDIGLSDSGGCIINTYVKDGATQEVITHAMAKALRNSKYCSDAKFAAWISAGSQWKAAYRGDAAPHHRPLTMDEMFGVPIQAAEAAA
jgi:hypothetical protein